MAAEIKWAFIWDHSEDRGVWHYYDEEGCNTFQGEGGRPKLFVSRDEARAWGESNTNHLQWPVPVIVSETDTGLVIAPLQGAFVVEKE